MLDVDDLTTGGTAHPRYAVPEFEHQQNDRPHNSKGGEKNAEGDDLSKNRAIRTEVLYETIFPKQSIIQVVATYSVFVFFRGIGRCEQRHAVRVPESRCSIVELRH